MFRRFLLPLVDFVLPPTCANCERELLGGTLAAGLCPDCFANLTFFEGPKCKQCAGQVDALFANDELLCGTCLRDPPAFSRTHAGFTYDGIIRKLILELKHAGRRHHASLLMAPLWEKLGALPANSVLIPIPLHPSRLRRRGFNQSLDLAHALNRKRRFEVWPQGLKRIKASPDHRKQSAHARRRNVQGAFMVARPDCIQGRTIVLVDDVITSGATIRAAAKVLKRAGASLILVFTAARALPRRRNQALENAGNA